MFENREILPPPWMALPEIEWGSMHWRMGIGEAYARKWGAWYRQLGEEEKREYLRLFPEPLSWRGFISGEPECEFVHEGDLYVTLWRKNGSPKYTRKKSSIPIKRVKCRNSACSGNIILPKTGKSATVVSASGGSPVSCMMVSAFAAWSNV